MQTNRGQLNLKEQFFKCGLTLELLKLLGGVCCSSRVREVQSSHPRPPRDEHGCTVGVLAGTHPCAAESKDTQQQSANTVRVAVLVLTLHGVCCARVVVWTRSCTTGFPLRPSSDCACFVLADRRCKACTFGLVDEAWLLQHPR